MKLQFLKRVTNYFKIGMLIAAMVFVVSCSNKDEDEPKTSNLLIGKWLSRLDYGKDDNLHDYTEFIYNFRSNGTFETNYYTYFLDGSPVSAGSFAGQYEISENNFLLFTLDNGKTDFYFFEIVKDEDVEYLIMFHDEEHYKNALKYRRVE